jgi:hypothetical protein
MSNAYDAPPDAGPDAGEPDAGAGPEPAGLSGPPQGGGGLLGALRQQQQGPAPSAPGPGNQANAMTMVQNAQLLLEQALPSLQGHPLYADITRLLGRMSRHMTQSPGTAGAQQTQMTDFIRMMARNAMLAQLRGRMGRGQMGAQPPNPSTPLPGA